MFSLVTLGVSSASPTTNRYPSAHILKICGRLFLIDCGEGTQMLLKRHHLSMMKIKGIFISHLHGDHLLGIFGLLSSMAMAGRCEDLHIYAPEGFEKFMEFYETHFAEGTQYGIFHHPLKGEDVQVLVDEREMEIRSFPLRHRVPTYGFYFTEKKSRKIPRSFAYCSDTAPLEHYPEFLRGVDILYHEATFSIDKEELSRRMFHSTAADAAAAARELSVGRLVIGHFSSRYSDPKVLLDEAREIFPETYLGEEGKVFDVAIKEIN